jgi:hypothetical protein
MSAPTDSHLEIAHVLFIDIVAYSKLLIDQQTELIKLLNEQVHSTEESRSAEAAGKLIRIATGDGMALAFFTSPDAPVRCALQLSEAIRQSPRLQLRMGINSGPVDQLADVNERSNIAGAGINTARRVMDAPMKGGKDKDVMPISTEEYNPCGLRAWLNGTTITFGVNNVLDLAPPFVAGAFENNYDEQTTNIKGVPGM